MRNFSFFFFFFFSIFFDISYEPCFYGCTSNIQPKEQYFQPICYVKPHERPSAYGILVMNELKLGNVVKKHKAWAYDREMTDQTATKKLIKLIKLHYEVKR